jgi:hypothetical protein
MREGEGSKIGQKSVMYYLNGPFVYEQHMGETDIKISVVLRQNVLPTCIFAKKNL